MRNEQVEKKKLTVLGYSQVCYQCVETSMTHWRFLLFGKHTKQASTLPSISLQ